MILPNQLTVLRIILTPVFLVLFLADDPLLKQISLVIFFIAAITDWYDGWLARKFNYITTWGKFMDPLADKVLTSTAFIAFAIMGVLQFWMVIVIILRDLIVTGLRLYADYIKVSFATSIWAKIKTFLQMVFIYYLLIVFVLKTFEKLYMNNINIFNILTNESLIYYSMLLVTLVTFFTGVYYVVKNKNLIIRLFTFES